VGVEVLTFKGWAYSRGNHPFWQHVNNWFKKNSKALLGSQTTIQDPFSCKIPKMNSYTFVLHTKILYHSSIKKWPQRRLWIKR